MNAVAANCIPSQGLHLEHIWIELSPFIHGDIIETEISSVITLYCCGKKNLLYILSKILSEHKLKLDQMPIGLIDYKILTSDKDCKIFETKCTRYLS